MSNNEPIFDAGKYKVTFTRPVPDGHNAAANRAQHDPYAMTVLQCKWNAGWIPHLECPQGTQHARWLPTAIQGRAKCRVAADGSPIGRDANWDSHPCVCVVEVVEARQKAQATMELARQQDKTDQQRILEATEKQTAMLVAAERVSGSQAGLVR